MTNENRTDDRDTVLFAFHQAYSQPTVDEIIEWTDKYPQFAEDIRAHAAVTWDWIAAEKNSVQADDSLVAEAYSRALDIIWRAGHETKVIPSVAARSFQEIMSAQGMTVPQVARHIGIKRGIVADLVSGRMLGPIKNVFVDATNSALGIGRDVFEAAHRRALTEPILGPAKADRAPSIVVRTYEEIIRTSDDLTDEEKLRWLEED